MKVMRTPGNVHIDAETDTRMRTFLLNACHPNTKFRMTRALDVMPRPADALDRVKRYFGGQGPATTALQAAIPVVGECEQYCPGLARWLIVTGYGNEPLMIAAFAHWAENPVDYSNLPTTRVQ
jgi:hypothetical protein